MQPNPGLTTTRPVSHHEETFEPATFGATPSSADALEEEPTPPPGVTQVSSWPMWLLGLVIMVDQVDQNIVRGVQGVLKEDMALNDFEIGLLLSSFVLVNGVITVPAGYLADRWNRSRTIGHTVVAWSAITALTGLFRNFGWLLAIRSALGFGQAITEPAAASLIADYYPVEKRGRAFSIQYCLLFVGAGLGIALGGLVANWIGWRWAFIVVGSPGVLIAFWCYRLREPRRGHADRLHLGLDEEGEDDVDVTPGPLAGGYVAFMRDMVSGLRADLRTILGITTMRYALVGVATLLFTITAVAAALPQFYERQLGADAGAAEVMVGALVILGGLPGVLVGGIVADRYATRIRGARMAIPAYCLLLGNGIVLISYLRVPLWPAWVLEIIGFFFVTMSIPSLRAGLADAVPANLRGAGFGAFNLCAVLFGQAAAPLLVFGLSGAFDDNLRTALLIVTPPVFIGSFLLLRARDHLDEDAAKIFQAIMTAMQEQQEREAREKGGT